MSQSVVLVTAPAELPITVEELKTQLRLEGDNGAHDQLLTSNIGAATALFERETRHCLITRTLKLCLDAFPSGNEPVYIPTVPVGSVVSVKHLDADKAQQTLTAGDDYQADVNHQPARVAPALGTSWPTTARMLGAVEIDFEAGYGSRTAVPEDARNAIKMLAAHYYENPEAASTLKLTVVPMAVQQVIDLYRTALV